jgi:uncharacterized protein (UPF0335 family)
MDINKVGKLCNKLQLVSMDDIKSYTDQLARINSYVDMIKEDYMDSVDFMGLIDVIDEQARDLSDNLSRLEESKKVLNDILNIYSDDTTDYNEFNEYQDLMY